MLAVQRVAGRRVDVVPGPARLRLVHRDVGAAQQGRDLDALLREQRDPDAGIHPHGDAVHRERRLQHRSDAAGQPFCLGAAGADQQDRELVTAQAGKHVAGGVQVLVQPGGHQPQQVVTCVMPEAVVHLFEPVEVQQQQRAAGVLVRELLLRGVVERPPVAEPGQLVGPGQLVAVGQRARLAERDDEPAQRDHDGGGAQHNREQVQRVLVVVDQHTERAQRGADREAESYPVGQRDAVGLCRARRSEPDDQGRCHPHGIAQPAGLIGAVAGREQVDGVGDVEQHEAPEQQPQADRRMPVEQGDERRDHQEQQHVQQRVGQRRHDDRLAAAGDREDRSRRTRRPRRPLPARRPRRRARG